MTKCQGGYDECERHVGYGRYSREKLQFRMTDLPSHLAFHVMPGANCTLPISGATNNLFRMQQYFKETQT